MWQWMMAFVAAALPHAGLAGDWHRLDGAAITMALTARVLGYADGTLQDFHRGGRTLAGMNQGEWKVDGDLCCWKWPPSDGWSCYGVEARGLDIRFTAKDGTVMIGRYVDLH